MKIVINLIFLTVFGYLIYAIFYGALLFINPIKVEYEHVKGSRSDVYVHDIVKLDPFYYEIENDIVQAEELTGLKFINKPVIYVAQDEDEFARFVPWIINNKDLGGVTLWVGNVIYINSEKIRQEKYIERDILRSELIHNLLAQNSIFINTLIIENHEWFIKGLAFYFGGPKYFSDLQFIQQFEKINPSFDMSKSKLFTDIPDDVKFNYSLYRLFIEFVIETYGEDKFRIFITRYLDSPTDFNVTFYEVYDEKLVVAIEEFMSNFKNE